VNIVDFIPTQVNLNDALATLRPLAIYVIGMSVYGVFIFKFYRFIGSKDIFNFDVTRYEQARFRSVRVMLHTVTYFLKYLIVFPVIAFFWFTVLTVLLIFLARNQTLPTVLLISMAIVSSIRVTAYYHEDLYKDLAKILPFALLGIFVIDFSYLKISESLSVLRQVGVEIETILYYLLFFIALEFLLRIITAMVGYILTPPRRRRREVSSTTTASEPTPEEQVEPEPMLTAQVTPESNG